MTWFEFTQLVIDHKGRGDAETVQISLRAIRSLNSRMHRVDMWNGHLQTEIQRVRRESGERVRAAYRCAQQSALKAGDSATAQGIESELAGERYRLALLDRDLARLDRFHDAVIDAILVAEDIYQRSPGLAPKLLTALIKNIRREEDRFRATPMPQLPAEHAS